MSRITQKDVLYRKACAKEAFFAAWSMLNQPTAIWHRFSFDTSKEWLGKEPLRIYDEGFPKAIPVVIITPKIQEIVSSSGLLVSGDIFIQCLEKNIKPTDIIEIDEVDYTPVSISYDIGSAITEVLLRHIK